MLFILLVNTRSWHDFVLKKNSFISKKFFRSVIGEFGSWGKDTGREKRWSSTYWHLCWQFKVTLTCDWILRYIICSLCPPVTEIPCSTIDWSILSRLQKKSNLPFFIGGSQELKSHEETLCVLLFHERF